MKVGIMSMQRIVNYGSFMQAYALSNIIKSLGHNVEFVDFKIEPCVSEPNKDKKLEDYPEGFKDYFYKLSDFDKKFSNEFLKDLGVFDRNERPDLDVLVIGSDEVFNCLQSNPEVGYSLELFGRNHSAKKLITYAACCGATTVEKLKSHNKHGEISDLLNEFDCISVRDENTRKFVKSLSNLKPINHLDPVLIYDFKNDPNIIDNVNIKDYIIVYSYPFNLSDEDSNYIKEFAKKHNKKILSIGSTAQTCTDIFIPAHPFEVLPYFEKADFVITNTFHGTIFSVKTHTPFVTKIRPNFNNEKLSDLLTRLDISDRKIDSYSELEEAFSRKMDFSKADHIIQKEKIRSIKYLESNMIEEQSSDDDNDEFLLCAT